MNKSDLIDFINKIFPNKEDDKSSEETKLEQFTLEDGVIIEYESLEVDQPIFIVKEEGNEPLPDGEYVIGTNLVIVLDGKISNVTEKQVEEKKEEVEKIEEKKVEVKELKQLEFAKIFDISKWTLQVENEDFKVGDIVMVKYDEQTEAQPLVDGEYFLEDGRKMQIDSEGKIVLISEKTTEEKKEEEVSFSKEDLDKKIEANKKEFDSNLEKEQNNFKIALEKITNGVKDSKVIQAPIETKAKTSTLKERVLKRLDKERQEEF